MIASARGHLDYIYDRADSRSKSVAHLRGDASVIVIEIPFLLKSIMLARTLLASVEAMVARAAGPLYGRRPINPLQYFT